MAEKNIQGGKIEEQALLLCEPIVTAAGFRLWDVCFEKEGAMWYLRVLFDGENSVDSDAVEELTRPINELFDKQEFIKHVDILEVGTPGLSKKLRKPEHFRRCVGQKIRVTVRDEKGKEISVFGVLTAYDEENASITVDNQAMPLAKCVKVNSDL